MSELKLTRETKKTVKQFDAVIKEVRELMIAKTHDYGDSWRDMRLPSITDQILIKVRRIRRLEELPLEGDVPLVSEGIEAEYRDILNYCVFALIRLREKRPNAKSGYSQSEEKG